MAVSSILFTLALLFLTPAMLGNALSTYQSRFRDIANNMEAMKADQVAIPNFSAPLGITSLAIIAIGLVVTWAGYIKGVRWTWFVMFVIVWVWAFPVVVLPFFYPWASTVSIAQALAYTLEDAISERGTSRTCMELVLMLLLMVVALILPVKTFIQGRGGGPGGSRRTNLGAPHKSTLPKM